MKGKAMTETTICVKCKHIVFECTPIMLTAHLCGKRDMSNVGRIDVVTGEAGKPVEVHCSQRDCGACPLWEAKE
jgi:hypothetical protein